METIVKILIVERDTAQAELLWTELRRAGHEPFVAFSVERANLQISQMRPDAILLRWELPDASGMSLLKVLRTRAASSRIPVIVLGEEGAGEDECVNALECGADDYVRRPFGIQEVIARVQAVLRAVPRAKMPHCASVETLTIDFDARRVLARVGQDSGEIELAMTPTCYRLLSLFVENPHQALSRKDIIHHVWRGAAVKIGVIDVSINTLRKTLRPLRDSLLIETVRGEGFRLSAAADVAAEPVSKLDAHRRADDARHQPMVASNQETAPTASMPSRRSPKSPHSAGRAGSDLSPPTYPAVKVVARPQENLVVRKSRRSEEQIVRVLKEADAGMKVADLCRKHGISESTFYNWRSRYGDMGMSEARQLRQLEEENQRLKLLVADQALNIHVLKSALGKQ